MKVKTKVSVLMVIRDGTNNSTDEVYTVSHKNVKEIIVTDDETHEVLEIGKSEESVARVLNELFSGDTYQVVDVHSVQENTLSKKKKRGVEND